MQGLNSTFVGLGNYVRMLQDPVFRQALFNNFLFLIFQVPIMLVLGLILAFILNSPRLKGRTFFLPGTFPAERDVVGLLCGVVPDDVSNRRGGQ